MVGDMLGYSVRSRDPVRPVPTLDDLIMHNVSVGRYTKSNFISFLSHTHSLENLEFIIELNKYLASDNELERRTRWKMIYKTFILHESSKEINLPHSITKNLSQQAIPNVKVVHSARQMIHDILLDSYNEFVKHVKATTSDHRPRRPSDSVLSSDPGRHPNRRQIPRSVSVSEHVRPYIPSSQDSIRHAELQRRKSVSPKAGSSSTSSSRGSSMGSSPDSMRGADSAGWKKAVRKFSFRRNSNE